ncbi:hypothetical protein GGR56DRAFT_564162 [Xylariaceae sp. FL0804]|nr:hypothetical protein GGR56DRAFT_564162 [Xylariaceae sp. FL0804]
MFSSKRFDPPPSKSFSKSQRTSRASSSFSKNHGVSKSRHESRRRMSTATSQAYVPDPTMSPDSNMTTSIVTLVLGRDQRIFAAHEDVLSASPWFQQVLASQPSSGGMGGGGTGGGPNKRVHLPDDEPEIFSCVLEYLYKGDYYPRLVQQHDRRNRNSWALEQPDEERGGARAATIYPHAAHGDLLKDTVLYCVADKYGLDELKRLALRKQGLHSGIQCGTILASARYAYANTPESDSKLRAHYLALIIRSRGTFKKSGTMQLEMYNGGTSLFFDLFVALCNHVDDISSASSTPRSNRHLF